MLKSATEIFKQVKRNRKDLAKKAAEDYEKKCAEAIEEKIEDGEVDTEIDLTDDDFYAIDDVTAKLSSLGVKYCLIERCEEDDITYHFRLSVAYLDA